MEFAQKNCPTYNKAYWRKYKTDYSGIYDSYWIFIYVDFKYSNFPNDATNSHSSLVTTLWVDGKP
ncbi:hypothetical protein GCM10026987_36230 [Belliella aquatica]|uniref:Uncharacterized protein n=1 Tax=Belliella aquatica TaxID=1323734 RepID=A0ABQ1LUT6_9BACT|nr:hypothetical protein GCM10010993_05910 [Belliella aquatica]